MPKKRSRAHMEMCRRLQKTFGENLKSARGEKGDMQKTLAVGMGLSRTTISNIERGAQRIYLDQVFMAAHLLNVPLEDLMPKLAHAFSAPAIRSSADDPLSAKVAAEAKRVLQNVMSGSILPQPAEKAKPRKSSKIR